MEVVKLTEAAQEQAKSLLQKESTPKDGLRVAVIGGGCSGLQYQLSFDDAVRESDNDFEANGVRLLIDEKSALYLVGTSLDFVDTLQESGFKIENPNASNTCGCGQSFAA